MSLSEQKCVQVNVYANEVEEVKEVETEEVMELHQNHKFIGLTLETQ